jgi:hypothetical protein
LRAFGGLETGVAWLHGGEPWQAEPAKYCYLMRSSPRQHQDQSADLKEESSEEQPEHFEGSCLRAQASHAHLRYELGEIARFRFGLSDDLGRGLVLLAFQIKVSL